MISILTLKIDLVTSYSKSSPYSKDTRRMPNNIPVTTVTTLLTRISCSTGNAQTILQLAGAGEFRPFLRSRRRRYVSPIGSSFFRLTCHSLTCKPAGWPSHGEVPCLARSDAKQSSLLVSWFCHDQTARFKVDMNVRTPSSVCVCLGGTLHTYHRTRRCHVRYVSLLPSQTVLQLEPQPTR